MEESCFFWGGTPHKLWLSLHFQLLGNNMMLDNYWPKALKDTVGGASGEAEMSLWPVGDAGSALFKVAH